MHTSFVSLGTGMNRIVISLVALLSLLSFSIPAFAQVSKFSVPETVEEIRSWPKVSGREGKDYDVYRSPRESDPAAPFGMVFQTGPKYGVTTFGGAIKAIGKTSKIDLIGKPEYVYVQAYQSWFGRQQNIVLQRTRRDGRKGVLVALLTSDQTDYRNINVIGWEISEDQFIESEGVLRMLKIRAPKYYAAIPPDVRKKIAKAPFKNQVATYNYVMAQVMSNGLSNLMRLQELQYDVLLGDDISSPFIAD